MNKAVNKGIKNKMEQILEKELEALNVGYLKRTTKEVLSSQMVVMGTIMPTVKMERPLEDHEVNAAQQYHSWWKDTRSRVESFDKKTNGDNRSLIGKKIEKMLGEG